MCTSIFILSDTDSDTFFQAHMRIFPDVYTNFLENRFCTKKNQYTHQHQIYVRDLIFVSFCVTFGPKKIDSPPFLTREFCPMCTPIFEKIIFDRFFSDDISDFKNQNFTYPIEKICIFVHFNIFTLVRKVTLLFGLPIYFLPVA